VCPLCLSVVLLSVGVGERDWLIQPSPNRNFGRSPARTPISDALFRRATHTATHPSSHRAVSLSSLAMERSRRTIKQRAPASKFEALKAARAGAKSRLDQYNPGDEDSALYDEVDEVDYQRSKLQDDFVVDDNGEGYVDNGMEEDLERNYLSDEDDEAVEAGKRGKKGKKKQNAKKENVKVSEGAIDRLFRKPAIQMAKKSTVSTEEDADFMASILGELDDTSTSTSRSLKRDRKAAAPAPDTRPTKKRHSSPTPPLRMSSIANRQPVAREPVKPEMPSSPPLAGLNLNSEDDGGFGDSGFMDMDSSDAYHTAPSSSPTKPKNGIDLTVDDDSEEEDIPVVKKLSAAKPAGLTTKSINISASKPAPPPPKPQIKKEPSPVPEVPDATWRDLDSTLNVKAAPSTPSANKADPSDVVETVTMTIKEIVDQDDGTEMEIEKQVEKQVVNFFWLDYGEFNGVLGLFGKVYNRQTQQYVSAFVKIEGMERCLYFLPRENNSGILVSEMGTDL
jgi:DNA polymerase alpha subunit A